MADNRLGAVLRRVRARFNAAGVSTPDLDARLIVEHFSGTTATQAITDPGKQLSGEICIAIDAAVSRRLSGEPVHRILGFREFYGLKLRLSPETLEPRPDTEILVDAALPEIRRIAAMRGRCSILDLGTGTGAIALALLHEVQEAAAVGVDISSDALETAAGNARELGLGNRFTPCLGSWFEKVEGRFDVIVSNPPYIKSNVIETLEREVRRFDPMAALDGGTDGLDAYKAIADGIHDHLATHGVLVLEIGYDQAGEVSATFAERGLTLRRKSKDLAGNDRILLFTQSKDE